jgi:hypothetical protein
MHTGQPNLLNAWVCNADTELNTYTHFQVN